MQRPEPSEKTPFHGLTTQSTTTPTDAPDDIDTDTDTMHDVLEDTLTTPIEGSIDCPNPFRTDDGTADRDAVTQALEDTEHLDAVELAATNPMIPGGDDRDRDDAIDSICQAIESTDHLPVNGHKLIIDQRRALLAATGYGDAFTWTTATDTYQHGNPVEFLQAKRAAVADASIKQDESETFGHLRYNDHGGDVELLTIYPDINVEIPNEDVIDATLPATDRDATDDDLVNLGDALQHARLFQESTTSNDSDNDAAKTICFGDRITYDVKGSSTLKLQPVLYDPETSTTIPVGRKKTRRHVGNIDKDTEQWHREAVVKLESIADTMRTDVIRAFALTVKQDALPFDLPDLYEYFGIQNDDVCRVAARNAQRYATVEEYPSLWSLQVGLLTALDSEYDGQKTGNTYREYEAVAAELLENPVTQLSFALKQYENDRDRGDETTGNGNGTDVEEVNAPGIRDDVEDVIGEDTDGQITLGKAAAIQDRIDESRAVNSE